MLGHYLDDAQNGSLLEVVDKLFSLFQVAKVIASGDEFCDLILPLTETVEPKVATKASLRRQLPIPRKVVVELVRLHVIASPVQVLHIQSHVELKNLSLPLLYQGPAQSLHCAPVERFSRHTLAEDL